MKGTLSLAASVVLLVAGFANAGVVQLGNSGWQAAWDSSLDPYVSIFTTDVTTDSVYIQKSAEFTQGPGVGGLFPTIPIAFQQIGPSTITEIVIQDEIITNSTGVDWTDFHFDLLDGPDAWFKHDPGFFFTTSPLNNQQFVNNDRGFWADGFGLGPGGTNAVVPNGSVWFPGDGATDGDLKIGVVSKTATPYTVFVLKETPTPEPTSLILLAIGGLMLRRR
jgi:hypothetical protein